VGHADHGEAGAEGLSKAELPRPTEGFGGVVLDEVHALIVGLNLP
jgi:hypothetical protein